ncbi:MAG: TIGR00366 family protein [Butyricimonas faecihominis]
MINIIIPSGSAKAALTMPIMAPFSDVIGLSRQATVMAFQFGTRFTNMITPTSGVLIGALGIARIPYDIRSTIFLEIDPAACHYRFRVINSHGNHVH